MACFYSAILAWNPTAVDIHRSMLENPKIAVRGKGLILELADGSKIIDASGGAAVACLGHGVERVADAIGRQARKLAYVHTGFYSSEPAEALADLLLEDRPGGLARAYFVSDGSVAMESALKIARQFHVERGEPQRVHYISRRLSYHGNLFGTLAASGNMARRSIYEDVLPKNFSQVSPCFAFRFQGAQESDAQYVQRLANELESEIQHIGPDRVAAFIAEPIVGATAGCVTAVPGYFPAMREICDRYGILLILDEIMCGMGRVGTAHAWQQEGVTPDIQAIAKGLGGGYQPIGGILISDRVVDTLSDGSGAFVHGHTYQAHPVACAGALEVQRIIREEALIDRVANMGKIVEGALRERFSDHPHVADIRGRGLFWALEFVKDRRTDAPFAPRIKFAERVKASAMAHGLGIYPTGGTIDGVSGDHALIAPPFIVTEDEIDEIVDRLAISLDQAVANIPGVVPGAL